MKTVKERDTAVILELAEKLNMTLESFGRTVRIGSDGKITLSAAWNYALEPAPVTPIDDAPYKLLSGTIRATYNTHRGSTRKQEIVVAPGIITGNTGSGLSSPQLCCYT